MFSVPSFDYRSKSYNSFNCKQIRCKGGAIIRTPLNYFGVINEKYRQKSLNATLFGALFLTSSDMHSSLLQICALNDYQKKERSLTKMEEQMILVQCIYCSVRLSVI